MILMVGEAGKVMVMVDERWRVREGKVIVMVDEGRGGDGG